MEDNRIASATVGIDVDKSDLLKQINDALKSGQAVASNADITFNTSLDIKGLKTQLKQAESEVEKIQKKINGVDLATLKSSLIKANDVMNSDPNSTKFVDNFIMSFKKYVALGGNINEINKDIIKDYNTLSGEKEFAPINSIKTLAVELKSAEYRVVFIKNQIKDFDTKSSRMQNTAQSIRDTSIEIERAQQKNREFTNDIKKGEAEKQKAIEKANQATKEIQDNKITIFDGVSTQIYDVEKDVDSLNKKLDEMAKKMKNVSFHAGDLSSKSLNSSDYHPADSYKFTRDMNRFDSPATGTYFASNFIDIKDWANKNNLFHIYATDLAKYEKSLLNINTDDIGAEYTEFLEKLSVFVMNAATGEQSFSDKLKKYKIESVDDLYKDGSNYFKTFNISVDQLSQWLQKEVVRVKDLEASTDDVRHKADSINTSFQKHFLNINGLNYSKSSMDDSTARGSAIFNIDKDHAFDIDFGRNDKIAIDFYQKVLMKKLEEKAGFISEKDDINYLIANYISDEIEGLVNVDEIRRRLENIFDSLNNHNLSLVDTNEHILSDITFKDSSALSQFQSQVEEVVQEVNKLDQAKAKLKEFYKAYSVGDISEEEFVAYVQNFEKMGGKFTKDMKEIEDEYKYFKQYLSEMDIPNLSLFINETPVSSPITSNKNTLSSEAEQAVKANEKITETAREAVQETEKLIQAQKEVGASSRTSDNSVTDNKDISKDQEELETLEQKVKDVTAAVDAKSTAFTQEKITVETAVQNEISELDRLINKVEEVSKSITDIAKLDIQVDADSLNKLDGSIGESFYKLKNSLNGNWDQNLKNVTDIVNGLKMNKSVGNNMQNLANAIRNLKSSMNNLSDGGSNFLNSIKELVSKGEELKSLASVLNATKKQLAQAASATNNTQTEGTGNSNVDKQKKSAEELEDAYTKAREKLIALQSDMSKTGYTSEELANVIQKIETILNGDITGRSKKDLKELNAQLSLARQMFTSLKKTSSEVENATKNVNALSWAFGGLINTAKQYFRIYTSPMDFIRYFRNGFNQIKEIDNAFSEMRKVSEESISVLRKFQKESYDTADSIGVTGLQLQQSTADWMRIGDAIDEASKHAEDANILMQVSEFDDIESATKSLVAMSQAWKDVDTSRIVDVMNIIGNEFSISTDELAESMQRSAGTLATLGATIEEVSALTVAGNAVLQDPNRVARGIRTIELRMVGKPYKMPKHMVTYGCVA